MPLSFPINATTGQLYSSGSSAVYRWDGDSWVVEQPETRSILSSSYSITSSYALGTAPKSGFLWTAQMGNPSIVGAVMGGTATYLNANQGVRLTQNTGGQYGYINFNAVGFDFNKDFRISVATYAGVVSGGTTTGDGIWIGFGGSSGIDRQANSQNAFSWWSSTFATNAGQWIYFNGAVVANDAGETSATGQWIANTIEARRNTVGSRTLSVFTNGAYRLSYTGNQTLAGSWITIGGSTGAAWADHYVRYICFEYI